MVVKYYPTGFSFPKEYINCVWHSFRKANDPEYPLAVKVTQ